MVLATVSFENFIVSEVLLADFAGKRHFFYGMHDGFVFPQSFGTYKCLPALNTQVVMRDNSIVANNHVVFQSLLVKIFVVTVVAREDFCIQFVVPLIVLSKVSGRDLLSTRVLQDVFILEAIAVN